MPEQGSRVPAQALAVIMSDSKAIAVSGDPRQDDHNVNADRRVAALRRRSFFVIGSELNEVGFKCPRGYG